MNFFLVRIFWVHLLELRILFFGAKIFKDQLALIPYQETFLKQLFCQTEITNYIISSNRLIEELCQFQY